MSYAMVQHLILKDWYFNRWIVLSAIAFGVISLALFGTGTSIGFYMGSTLILTVLIGGGVFAITETVLKERTDQTLPFVMSLPISVMEYSTAKILGNLLIFLVPFCTLLIGIYLVFSGLNTLPDGLIPFAVIVLVEVFAAFCIILGVAMISESLGWTISLMVVLNLFLNFFLYTIRRIPSIGDNIEGPVAVWNAAVFSILAGEFGVILLALGLTFYFQSRKTDFL